MKQQKKFEQEAIHWKMMNAQVFKVKSALSAVSPNAQQAANTNTTAFAAVPLPRGWNAFPRGQHPFQGHQQGQVPQDHGRVHVLHPLLASASGNQSEQHGLFDSKAPIGWISSATMTTTSAMPTSGSRPGEVQAISLGMRTFPSATNPQPERWFGPSDFFHSQIQDKSCSTAIQTADWTMGPAISSQPRISSAAELQYPHSAKPNTPASQLSCVLHYAQNQFRQERQYDQTALLTVPQYSPSSMLHFPATHHPRSDYQSQRDEGRGDPNTMVGNTSSQPFPITGQQSSSHKRRKIYGGPQLSLMPPFNDSGNRGRVQDNVFSTFAEDGEKKGHLSSWEVIPHSLAPTGSSDSSDDSKSWKAAVAVADPSYAELAPCGIRCYNKHKRAELDIMDSSDANISNVFNKWPSDETLCSCRRKLLLSHGYHSDSHQSGGGDFASNYHFNSSEIRPTASLSGLQLASQHPDHPGTLEFRFSGQQLTLPTEMIPKIMSSDSVKRLRAAAAAAALASWATWPERTSVPRSCNTYK